MGDLPRGQALLESSGTRVVVNIADVFSIILGFQGQEYPGPEIELCTD